MPRSLARLAARALPAHAASSLARRAGTALLLFAAVASCRDGGTGPLRDRSVALALRPSFALAATAGLPINEIRLVARNVDGGEELARSEVPVDPAATEWPLTLDVRIPGGASVSVIVTVELINLGAANDATVEWSGSVGPILVRPGVNEEVADVALGRGPLENLLATAVDILPPPTTLTEGESFQATAVISGAPEATPFWASLDEAVATVDATGLVHALLPGTARIVASAGVKADTVPIAVGQLPTEIRFSSDSVRLASLGAQERLAAEVLDPRGAPIAAAQVTWSVGNEAIAKHVGDGVFQAVTNGITPITAAVLGRPAVTKTTGLRVTQVVASVQVGPRTASLVGLGATTTLNAASVDAMGAPIPNPQTAFAWSSSNAAVATVDGAGKVTATGRGTAFVRAAIAGKIDSAAVTVTVIAPASLVKLAGDGQTARVASTVAVAPSVRVLDAAGAPAAGVTVTFAVASGGGAVIAPATVVSGADGVATAGGWSLGATAGTNTLTATVQGLPPATFTATGTPAPASVLRVVSGSNQSGTSGSALQAPLVVEAIDAFGNRVSGVPVTWTTSHDGTVSPASGPTDAAGLARTTFVPGFRATFQTVTASSPGLDNSQAVFGVTVTVPPSVTVTGKTVGSGLLTTAQVSIAGAAPTGGLTVTLTSSSAVVLLSSSPTAVGASSATVTIQAGFTSAPLYVHGVEGQTGAATVTASASGYVNGTATMTTVQPGVQISGLGATHDTFEQVVNFIAQVGVPNASGTGLAELQSVRPGAQPITVTFASDNPQVAQIQWVQGNSASATSQIPVGSAGSPSGVPQGGVAYDAVGAGTARISASIPGFVATGAATVVTTVTAPAIGVNAPYMGAGLQAAGSFSLAAAAPTGGVTVRLTSADPSAALLAPDSRTAGASFVDVPVAAGARAGGFWVQAIEGKTGLVTVTATALNYASGTGSANVVTPAFDVTAPLTMTALGPDQPVTVRVGVPVTGANPAGLNDPQAVRVGGPTLTASLSVSDARIATLVTSASPSGASNVSVQIVPGQFQSATTAVAGGAELHALNAGTLNVAAVMPDFPSYVRTTAATKTVTVNATPLSLGTLSPVGAELQQAFTGTLGSAAPVGGVSITITVSDEFTALVADSDTSTGTKSITVLVPQGGTTFTYYVQGLSVGTPNLTATAARTTGDTKPVSIVAPAIAITSLANPQAVDGADDEFQVVVGVPTADKTAIERVQPARAHGGGIYASIVLDNSLAVLKWIEVPNGSRSASVQISEGSATSPATYLEWGVAFDPLRAGQVTVSPSVPNGPVFIPIPLLVTIK